MTDLTVVILTKNERLHMRRCLERLTPLEAKKIYIVDCFSTDGTQEIATELGAQIVEHEWPGNQALQFNWALDNLTIKTNWVLRIDADEWLTPELIGEIKQKLSRTEDKVCGFVLKRRLYFSGQWIKRGMYPTRILRIFKYGHARYDDNMVMDEHLVVDGIVVELKNDFVDESLIDFKDWKMKHIGYAKREAQMAVNRTVNKNKKVYYRLPPYIRSFAYFFVRYILNGGFLDGFAGFRWHFWQGLWYRLMVDSEIGKLKVHKKIK